MMERVFLRFGDLPASGRSENFDTGELEAGVSVWAAEWDADEQHVVVYVADQPAAASLGHLSDRPAYLVTGTVVGRGSDGEPLLSDATAVPVEPAEIGWVVDDWGAAWSDEVTA